MEQSIRYLIEQDQAAQAALRENQQRRQQMADEMAKIREDMQKENSERAQERVDQIERQSKAEYEQELARLHTSFEAALGDLKQNYESHREEWIKTIVQRCLDDSAALAADSDSK
ncbi:MAG: hypothetical protein HFG26_02655 [Provencibacterium sp.]|nr:hypothetical protein [Provencibacterium sp.]